MHGELNYLAQTGRFPKLLNFVNLALNGMAKPMEEEFAFQDAPPLELGMVANPEGFMLSALCNRLEGGRVLVSAIRQHVSDALLVPENSFSFSVGDRVIDGDDFLQVDDAAFLEVTLSFDSLPPHLFSLNRADHVLRVMRVDVDHPEGGEPYASLVTVVRSHVNTGMGNLGGYRNKTNGSVFLNAAAQTDVSAGKKAAKVSLATISREVQTIGRSKTVQTLREGFVQMPKPGGGLALDRESDVVLKPGPYLSAATVLQFRRHACIRIQAVVRGFQARVRARALRAERDQIDQVAAMETEALVARDGAARKRDIARRTNPRTAEDFNILRSELEAWSKEEAEQGRAAGDAVGHKDAYDKHMKLHAQISSLEARAKADTAKSATVRLLDRMAQPKRVRVDGGKDVLVETPFTTRAAELKALMTALTAPVTSIDGRLDVLLSVKWTIREIPCPLTVELAELIDREADLLHRGRRTVGGLRRRIAGLFETFCTIPEFNPEAVHHQPAPLEYLSRSGVHAKPIRGVTRPLLSPPSAPPDRDTLDPLAAAPSARAGVTLPRLASPPKLTGPRARRAPPVLRAPGADADDGTPIEPGATAELSPRSSSGPPTIADAPQAAALGGTAAPAPSRSTGPVSPSGVMLASTQGSRVSAGAGDPPI